MVIAGDKITNARTGQTMLFLKTGAETNGELLQIDCTSPPSGAVREPEHIHPVQENRFEMLSGACVFQLNGKEQTAHPGDIVTIPAGVKHCFWNAGDTDARYIQEFRPALNIAGFFATFFALSQDGKLNAKGIPNFFHGSLILLKHKNEIRVTNPPWALQLLTYWTLAPIGFLMGYRGEYPAKR